ncbi:MAG: type IV pilus modification protein PilV [Pseudomonadota bacterium]
MRRDSRPLYSITAQHGFSMLEILVTLVIVATALFGTAGLQVYAMRMNQGAQFRTQAIFLASDIAERMETNKAAALAGSYELAETSATGVAATDCSNSACDEASLAAWDLAEWGNVIAGLLPQASWQITRTVTGNPSTYEIVINWTDRRTNTQYATAGTGETFSYTATRTLTD